MDPVTLVFNVEDAARELRTISDKDIFLERLEEIQIKCRDLEVWINSGGHLPNDGQDKDMRGNT